MKPAGSHLMWDERVEKCSKVAIFDLKSPVAVFPKRDTIECQLSKRERPQAQATY